MNRAIRSNYLISAILFFVLFISACTNPKPTRPVPPSAIFLSSTPQLTSSITPAEENLSETPSLEHKNTVIPSATFTLIAELKRTASPSPMRVLSNTPAIDLSNLEGDFIVMLQSGKLVLVSSDLKTRVFLKSITDPADIAITLDGNKVGFIPWEQQYPGTTIITLEQLEFLHNFQLDITGCSSLAFSPYGTNVVFICNTENGGLNVFLYDFKRKVGYPVLNEDPVLSPSQVSWSPDGQWITYINIGEYFEPIRTIDGLYFLEASCLYSSDPCSDNPNGPYLNTVTDYKRSLYFSAWSPDSQTVAVIADEEKIILMNVVSKSTTKIVPLPERDHFARVFFSPDGDQLFVSQENPYLISLLDNSVVKIHGFADSVVIGWIRRVSFEMGAHLAIAPAGNGINFRETPSLDGNIIKKFLAGDEIEILDGPVESGGYRWWKVNRLQDNSNGWVAEIPGWYKAIASTNEE